MRACALLLAAALLPSAAAAARYQAVVTHVSDGDTVWVQRVGAKAAPSPVRLAGIDAPETCQAGGLQARDALAGRVLHRTVLVVTRGRDGYDRSVGQIQLAREDLGSWMVREGHAWSYRFRSSDGPYAREQAAARAARRGLWGAMAPERPRDFRLRHGSCR